MFVERVPNNSVGSCLIRSKEGKLSTLERAPKAGEALAYRKEACMKRTMLLIASMMLALLVAAGVAPAQDGVSKVCNTSCSGTDGDDQLSGTANPNISQGRNGGDRKVGKGDEATSNEKVGEDGGNGS